MLQPEQIEELITIASSLDREALESQFRAFPARFPIDFTPEFLHKQSVDRLRHLFVALCLQTKQVPQIETAEVVQLQA